MTITLTYSLLDPSFYVSSLTNAGNTRQLAFHATKLKNSTFADKTTSPHY